MSLYTCVYDVNQHCYWHTFWDLTGCICGSKSWISPYWQSTQRVYHTYMQKLKAGCGLEEFLSLDSVDFSRKARWCLESQLCLGSMLLYWNWVLNTGDWQGAAGFIYCWSSRNKELPSPRHYDSWCPLLYHIWALSIPRAPREGKSIGSTLSRYWHAQTIILGCI